MKKYISSIYSTLTGRNVDREVGLYYWSPDDHRGDENFGDYLSKVIVQHVVEGHYENLTQAIKYDASGVEDRLLAIGSILHHAQDHDTIWGSGVNGKALGQKPSATTLDVRMVRGPLTRNFLLHHGISCPQTYGEPGLLVSEFFGNDTVSTKRDFSLVLNLNDVPLYEDTDYIIYPDEGLSEVIRQIRASEMVVSTSLHGLVIAEAFGVPARHLLSFAEPTFKYIDYYEGTGRSNVEFAQTLDEAITLGGVRAPELNLQTMVDCFPHDILRNRV